MHVLRAKFAISELELELERMWVNSGKDVRGIERSTSICMVQYRYYDKQITPILLHLLSAETSSDCLVFTSALELFLILLVTKLH